jgi:3-hydroxy acid dehydrogenase/malonic semialdehyde reductase
MNNNYTLIKKIILITGASSGIGEACAHAFAEQGAYLILTARRLDRLTRISAEIIDKYNVKCHFMLLDVRERDEITKFIDNLPNDFKDIDILINNAGLASGMAPMQEGDFADWDRMIDTNIKGLLNVTRLVVPGMIERGAGHIINIGSIAGRQVYPQGAVYCASKFAVSAINQGLAIDLLDTPVRVSSVDPGATETEFALVRFAGDVSRAKQVYQGMTPLTGQDVADAILYVATRPPHVNISDMLIVPADQASAYHVHRK